MSSRAPTPGTQHGRDRQVRNRLLDRRRGRHHDRATPTRLHRRHDCAHHADNAEDQQIEAIVPGGVVELHEAAGWRATSVREEQIDPAEALQRRIAPGDDAVVRA